MVNVIAYDGSNNSFQFVISKDLPKPKFLSFNGNRIGVSDGKNYLIIRTDHTPIDNKSIYYFSYYIWLRIPSGQHEVYDIEVQKQNVEHTDSADVAYNLRSAVEFLEKPTAEFRIGRTTFIIDKENRKITFIVPRHYMVNC